MILLDDLIEVVRVLNRFHNAANRRRRIIAIVLHCDRTACYGFCALEQWGLLDPDWRLGRALELGDNFLGLFKILLCRQLTRFGQVSKLITSVAYVNDRVLSRQDDLLAFIPLLQMRFLTADSIDLQYAFGCSCVLEHGAPIEILQVLLSVGDGCRCRVYVGQCD